jgi:hypothetical protein
MRARDDKRRKERQQQAPQRQPRQADRAALDKLIAVLAGVRRDANKQQQ